MPKFVKNRGSASSSRESSPINSRNKAMVIKNMSDLQKIKELRKENKSVE